MTTPVTVSAEYADQIDAIITRIEHTKMLRDAQVAGSERGTQYQTECTELTHELERWKEHAPRLDELKDEIAIHDRDLNRSARQADTDARTMKRVAILCGVLTLLTATLGLTVLSPWFVLLAVVLGAGMAAALFRGRTIDQEQADRAETLRSRLEALNTEFSQLRSELRYYA